VRKRSFVHNIIIIDLIYIHKLFTEYSSRFMTIELKDTTVDNYYYRGPLLFTAVVYTLRCRDLRNSNDPPNEICFLSSNLHIQQAVNIMLSRTFGQTIRNSPHHRNIHFTLFEQTSHHVRSNLNSMPVCTYDRSSLSRSGGT